MIGEVALDAPACLHQRPVDGLDVFQEINSNPLSFSEEEVWVKEKRILTALILEPIPDSVLVYRRLVLLFLTDWTWFDLSSSVLNKLNEGTRGAFTDDVELV